MQNIWTQAPARGSGPRRGLAVHTSGSGSGGGGEGRWRPPRARAARQGGDMQSFCFVHPAQGGAPGNGCRGPEGAGGGRARSRAQPRLTRTHCANYCGCSPPPYVGQSLLPPVTWELRQAGSGPMGAATGSPRRPPQQPHVHARSFRAAATPSPAPAPPFLPPHHRCRRGCAISDHP